MARDYKSWQYTQKVIRVVHNRAVFDFFKKQGDQDRTPGTGESAIRSALIIRKTDSALQIANKQLLLQSITQSTSLAIPESWIVKSLGNDIPQLKIIYRVEGKSRSGEYDITIPHYTGSKNIKPPKYTKGNQPVTFNLKDRTKIIINATSEEEGKSVIRYFLRFVSSRWNPENKDNFVIGSKSKVRREKMKPTKAVYFPKGQIDPNPAWTIYF